MDRATSDPQQLLTSILNSVSEQEPGVVFLLIGSRASGRNRIYSDFDLGVSGGPVHRLETGDYFRIRSRVDDATEDFPFSVDLVNLDLAPDWFLAGLNDTPLYLAGDRESHAFVLGVLNGFRKSGTSGASRRASRTGNRSIQQP
jgi:predicted nucleotidyltransferase